jgi:hypothetical protein
MEAIVTVQWQLLFDSSGSQEPIPVNKLVEKMFHVPTRCMQLSKQRYLLRFCKLRDTLLIFSFKMLKLQEYRHKKWAVSRNCITNQLSVVEPSTDNTKTEIGHDSESLPIVPTSPPPEDSSSYYPPNDCFPRGFPTRIRYTFLVDPIQAIYLVLCHLHFTSLHMIMKWLCASSLCISWYALFCKSDCNSYCAITTCCISVTLTE